MIGRGRRQPSAPAPVLKSNVRPTFLFGRTMLVERRRTTANVVERGGAILDQELVVMVFLQMPAARDESRSYLKTQFPL
jgi:hypothetical protein